MLEFHYFCTFHKVALPREKVLSRCEVTLGAYSSLENAKKACKVGYSVFDANGNLIYISGGKYTKGQKVAIRVNMTLFTTDLHKHQLLQFLLLKKRKLQMEANHLPELYLQMCFLY
jgi:hypothetical protein